MDTRCSHFLAVLQQASCAKGNTIQRHTRHTASRWIGLPRCARRRIQRVRLANSFLSGLHRRVINHRARPVESYISGHNLSVISLYQARVMEDKANIWAARQPGSLTALLNDDVDDTISTNGSATTVAPSLGGVGYLPPRGGPSTCLARLRFIALVLSSFSTAFSRLSHYV